MLFSIIIPVYNVGPELLNTCLQSVFCQDISISEYEVIVVNDGTKDNSLLGAEPFTSNTNFRIINQENQGLGFARNTGIKASAGEYLIFIDSDDFIISRHFLNTLKTIINQKKYDVIAYGSQRCDFSGKQFYTDKKFSSELYSRKSPSYVIGHEGLTSAWCKTVRRDFLLKNGIFFAKGYSEDIFWTFRIFGLMKSFNYCDIPFYAYRQGRKSSITSNNRINFVDVYLDIIDLILASNTNYFNKQSRVFLNDQIYIVFCLAAKNGVWDDRMRKLPHVFYFTFDYVFIWFSFLIKIFRARLLFYLMKTSQKRKK